MKLFLTLYLLVICNIIQSQTTADFEAFNINKETFLNGSEGSGGYEDGNIFLPNNYNEDWESWTGWAISAYTDTLTPGYNNQYSCIAGAGVDGSKTYATTYVVGKSTMMLNGVAKGGVINSIYVNNNTYSYLSMLNGDAFAKRFGGETGDDPDFFLLTIKKYLNGETGEDSINIYLADFRFENNDEDYIVKDWSYVDLRPLGNVDSLSFTLSSSDVGAFGMNTPAYFCIDNVETADDVSTTTIQIVEHISVHPNPGIDRITIQFNEPQLRTIQIYNQIGQQVINQALTSSKPSIYINEYQKGLYFGIVKEKEKTYRFSFVKN